MVHKNYKHVLGLFVLFASFLEAQDGNKVWIENNSGLPGEIVQCRILAAII